MSLFTRLKALFDSDRLPGEDRRAYAESKDLTGLLKRLEDNVTRNEVILRQIKASISKLELTEQATVSNIKRGNVRGRGVRLALQTINRYRKQLDGLMQKADIINKNLNLNINLIGKIELMQAMELKGVRSELIDQLIMDFDSNVEKYQENVVSADAITQTHDSMLGVEEQRELAALEKELLGTTEHFGPQTGKAKQPVVADDEGDEFEPLPTDQEIQDALDESDRLLREISDERKKLLEE